MRVQSYQRGGDVFLGRPLEVARQMLRHGSRRPRLSQRLEQSQPLEKVGDPARAQEGPKKTDSGQPS